VLAMAVVAAVSRIPQPHPPASTPPVTTTTPVAAVPDDTPLAPLTDEVGRHQNRSIFGSSGRSEAWRGAIGQGNARPLLGYGFGTEERVFDDRYRSYQGDRVENSFIGMYLQLGAVGLAALIALLAAVATAGLRARRSATNAALLGVVAGGIVLMCGQSFAYSAGNVATLPFWLCACLVAAPAARAVATRHALAAVAGLAIALALLAPLGRWQRERAIARTGRAIEALARIPGPQFRSQLSGARIARGLNCLLYSAGGNPAALELCFASDGHLAEAIDRRRVRGGFGTPVFHSLRDDPGASPVRPPMAILVARFHEAGLLLDVPPSATTLPVSSTDYGPVLIP
jgi:hypothetical protein